MTSQVAPIPFRVKPITPITCWRDYLECCWAARRCIICLRFGWCPHRQPEAESISGYLLAVKKGDL